MPPAYTNSELPIFWTVANLGSISLDIQPGFARQPNESNEGCRQLRMPSISRSGFIDYTVSKFVDASDEEKAKYSVRKGDVIFNNTNSPELVGNAAVFEDEMECVLSNHMTRIRVDERIVYPSYLAAVLHRYWRTGQTQRRAKQWINQAAIDIGTLSRFRIPLPPLSEQQRIVDILQEAEEIRRLRAQAEAKTAELIPALFHAFVSMRSSSVEMMRIGDIVSLKSGAFLSEAMMKKGEYPVYGGNGVAGYHDEFMFESPTICIGRVGAYCGAVHLTDPKAWITDNALYVSDFKCEIEPRFLAQALIAANLNRYASQGGQPLISGSRINPVKLPILPISEQREFSAILGELDLHQTAERQISLRGGLLDASLSAHSFTGQLTEGWREANQQKLTTEARERDIALGTVDRNVITMSGHIKLTARVSARLTVLREALSHTQQQVLNAIEEHFAPERSGVPRWFTANALARVLGEASRDNVQAIQNDLAVLTVRGYVQATSREQADGQTGVVSFATAYRLPMPAHDPQGDEGTAFPGDHSREREMQRLAAKLIKLRAVP